MNPAEAPRRKEKMKENDIDDTSDNSYQVVTGADSAIIDGFIITGGHLTVQGCENSQRKVASKNRKQKQIFGAFNRSLTVAACVWVA